MKGWQDVAKVECEELRRTPLHVKFKQIIAAFQLGVGLGLLKRPKVDNDIEHDSSNWALLKSLYDSRRINIA